MSKTKSRRKGNDNLKRYVTNRDLVIEWYGRWDKSLGGVTINIPAGHPVQKLEGGMGHRFVADQPSKLLDPKTQGFELHDATYYGIDIPEDAVSEV
jgi:hypothetical protein